MKVIHRSIIVPGRSATVRVWALSDLHLGSVFCDEALLTRTVAEIANDPLSYWVGLGDYAEWINRRDPRFRESRLAKWLHGKDDTAAAQRTRVLDVLMPIRGKCLGLVKGNHEDAILQHSETDVYGPLVEGLRETPEQHLALGVQGFVVLALRRCETIQTTRAVTFYLAHGWTGGQLAGGKALALERLRLWYDADVYLLGHNHDRSALAGRLIIGAGQKKEETVTHPVVGAFCGSFLRGYDPTGEAEQYSEGKGGGAYQLGPVVVEIQAFIGQRDEWRLAVRV